MAQPLIKFFRVASLPSTGTPGALYFVSGEGVLYVCTSEKSFEAYAGIKTAALNGSVLTLTPSVGEAISVDIAALAQGAIDLSGYVEKTQTIAGIDLQDNITAEELKTALGLTDENLSGEANVLEGVKVNGEALTIDADKTVDILVAEGSANGTISVSGKDVAVHGLGSAAYTDASAYDAAGAAAQALKDAKEYADGLPHENTTYTFANGTELGQFTVTPSNGTAQTVTVGGLGTAASKSEGYFVKSEGYVAYSEPEKTKLAGIEAGAEVNIIETVKVNGVPLIPDANRAVDVTIPDAAVQGVKSGEKVLALDSADGMLSTTISMEYKSTSEGGDGYIYLKGIGGAELGKIDAAEFVKDGMIDSVVMGENNVLTITWNTASGKTEATTIDFSKYIDTFTHYGAANGIKVEDNKYVGVVDSASETFLTVGEDGFKLSGVQTAINTAAAKATTVVVEGTDAGNNLSIVESTAADGHSIYTVNLTDVASAKDLSDLTTVVNDNEQVTAAALNDLNDRLAALKTGVSSISGDDTDYVNVSAAAADDNGNVALTVTVDKVEATDKTKYASIGLATDGYVKEQVATVAATADTAVQNIASKDSTIQVTRAENSNDVNLELVWASF